MRKFTLLLVLSLLFLSKSVFAQGFDFNKIGDENSNKILKNYIINNEIEGFHGNVVSYFYDINNDNRNEIIGIVKSKLFCTIEGCNLVILKEDMDGWRMLPTKVFLDNYMPFNIEGNKVTYYKSAFLKNKKTTATIKDNSYRAAASIKEYYTSNKIKGIEAATDITEGHPSVEVNVSDFPECEQKTYKIEYPEGYEKPKYRIEIH